MANIFGRWLAYGLGRSIGGIVRDDDQGARPGNGPVRAGTEEDFRRDEARFREDEKRIESAVEAARKSRK
jgi:hypothetical protein